MTTVFRGRAPLRIGLAGGGTDVSPYSEEYGGRILNATIDKYAFASVRRIAAGVIFDSPDRVLHGSATHPEIDSLAADFGLHVAVYRRMIRDYNRGEDVAIRLTTQVDAPPGSGLGSSSTLVVAMVSAMAEFLGVAIGPYEHARLAWEIERVDLGLRGGWQDQYSATFGGVNYMESRPDGSIVVNPLRLRREVVAELEASLLLYFGGVSRNSAAVIAEQARHVVERDSRALDATHAIRVEAERMKDHLVRGDFRALAGSLRDGWLAKKQLATGISTPEIEHAYGVAESSGMIAGKVSGAGGGGFMMLFVEPERRLEVTRALQTECGGLVLDCLLTDRGVESWRTAG